MARTGTSVYPATLDAFDRIGTANYEDESGYDHVNVHNEVMDGIEHIQAAIGTTAGTNVLKNAVAGQFVSFTAGTETLTNKTINNAVIGTPAITGGTSTTQTLTSPTLQGNVDGWILANETWTYASATTITVPSGAASKYSKGDKIKLTQTTVKYFYIIGVADTVLTITGGASYTLVNAAISSNYYSHGSSPVGFNHWMSLGTPTWSAAGTNFTNQPINNTSYMSIVGNNCNVSIQALTSGTSGATAAFTATFSAGYLPASGNTFTGGAINFSAGVYGFTTISDGGTTNIVIAKYDGAAIAGNSSYFAGCVSYKF